MKSLLDEYNTVHAFPAFDPLLEPLSSSISISTTTSSNPHQHLQDARYFGSPDGESSISSSPSSGFAAFPSSFYGLSSDPSSPATYATFVDPGLLAAASPYSSSQGDASSPRVGADDILGDSSLGGRDYPVCCLFAGCDAKPFKRRADLDRHYKHKHADDSAKESWFCDYPRCARRQDPFHRRDHFRDHLREFHKEDIEKRGGSVNEDWLGDRNTSDAWWRCAKCLVRCYVERSGYDCPGCKHSCLPKRKALRQKD